MKVLALRRTCGSFGEVRVVPNETKDVLDDTFASLLVQQAQILDPLSSSHSAKEITGHPGVSLVR